MLFGLILFVFVIVCVLLCLVILIQSDKGGGISSAFGGGLSGASALLGTQDTANILTKGTWWLAGIFGALCLILSLVVGRMEAQGGGKSILKARAEKNESPSSILQGGGLKLEEDNPAAGQPGAANGGLGIKMDEGTAQPAQPAQPVQPAPTGQQ
jgi:preprotein translocase subunit SecG